MTELRHLQLVILQIAKDLDTLCRNNGIQYYLLGGSAIGAIRHKGFIPWDDDYDIIMDSENYDKFIYACRTQLDKEKYYFQEGYKDWPCPFSKVKLRGTVFEEATKYVNDSGEMGIFVDIFKMEKSPSQALARRWQYFCAKYLLCYSLLERGWNNPSLNKRLMMYAAFPLKISILRKFLQRQVEGWNDKETDYYGYFSGPYHYCQCFFQKKDFCKSIYVPFEDTLLPLPQGYDNWLRHIFGDYLTPPPTNEQEGHHLRGVEFGTY